MGLTVKTDPDRKPGKERGDTPAPLQTTMATIHDDDELLLARIGYKQVCVAKGLVKIIVGHNLITIYSD